MKSRGRCLNDWQLTRTAACRYGKTKEGGVLAKLGPTWACRLLTILATENNKLEFKVQTEHQHFRVIGEVALESRINALGRCQNMHFSFFAFYLYRSTHCHHQYT